MQAASLPPPVITPIHPRPGGFRGTAPHAGAVLLADQYDAGWRVQSGAAAAGPGRAFGWAMRFPVSTAGPVAVEHPSNTDRRIEIVLLIVAWAFALWITRKPSRA